MPARMDCTLPSAASTVTKLMPRRPSRSPVPPTFGRRPHNRGVVMNPVDHPMGGGEGRQSGGHPRSRKGLYAKGLKTRAPILKVFFDVLWCMNYNYE